MKGTVQMSPWGPKNVPAARRLAVAMSASQIEHQMFLASARDQAERVSAKASRPTPAKRTDRKSGEAVATVDITV